MSVFLILVVDLVDVCYKEITYIFKTDIFELEEI